MHPTPTKKKPSKYLYFPKNRTVFPHNKDPRTSPVSPHSILKIPAVTNIASSCFDCDVFGDGNFSFAFRKQWQTVVTSIRSCKRSLKEKKRSEGHKERAGKRVTRVAAAVEGRSRVGGVGIEDTRRGSGKILIESGAFHRVILPFIGLWNVKEQK